MSIKSLIRQTFRKSRRRRRNLNPFNTEHLEDRMLLSTFYVNGDTGRQDGDGSAARPYATIQEAVDAAANNEGADLIRIRPTRAPYAESVSINDASGALSITGYGGVPTVKAPGANVFDVSMANDVKLSQLNVIDGKTGIAATGGSSLTLFRVKAINNDTGVRLESLDSAALKGVDFHCNRADGLTVEDVAKLDVMYSRFAENEGAGIRLTNVESAEMDKVSVIKNKKDGIKSVGTEAFKLSRGYLSTNGADGLDLMEGKSVVVTGTTATRNKDRGIHICGFSTVDISKTTSSYNGDSGVQVMMTEATTLDEVRLYGNSAERYGGGAYIAHGGSAKITNSLIGRNKAVFGGGVYLSGLTDQSVIASSTVYRNSLSGYRTYGGGVYNNGPLAIENSKIYSNHARGVKTAGGGVYNTSDSGQMSISNSLIGYNRVMTDVRANGFSYGLGGGIYVGLGADAKVDGSRIYGNDVIASSRRPEGKYRARGGGAYKNSGEGTSLTITNSSVSKNRATEGGGLYGYNKGLAIGKLTFHQNKATKDKDIGGTWEEL